MATQREATKHPTITDAVKKLSVTFNFNYEEALQIVEDSNIIQSYFNKITSEIKKIKDRPEKDFKYEPTLLGDNSAESINAEAVSFKKKQEQMKEGEYAQVMIGNFPGWRNLKTGHETGCDCLKDGDYPILLEVKNKYNTCNSGSLKSVYDKLADYKKKNPKQV